MKIQNITENQVREEYERIYFSSLGCLQSIIEKTNAAEICDDNNVSVVGIINVILAQITDGIKMDHIKLQDIISKAITETSEELKITPSESLLLMLKCFSDLALQMCAVDNLKAQMQEESEEEIEKVTGEVINN